VNGSRRVVIGGLALAAVLLSVAIAAACPTCKDNLAHDPASANLVRGYAYSILFMLSMPPLIFSGLSAYFYWEVRKAKARQAKADQDARTEPDLAVDGR
jgi:heme/copper-type cytochrome/quinol oxidase subunit 2